MNAKHDFSKIPKPANQLLAEDGLEIFKNETSVPHEVVQAVFGNSPYLSKLMRENKKYIGEVYNQGFENSLETMLNILERLVITDLSKEDLMYQLRFFKSRISLLIALADITDRWDLVKTTNALSDFADLTVQKSLEFLLHKRKQVGVIDTTDLGFFILALGKLGGRELNYSSDIDLIMLFDHKKSGEVGSKGSKDFFVKLAQELIEILQKKTADGYVFRVDMRLRPDPFSTPLVLSTASAKLYYENVGQNWERAALIKSRFIAGDEETANGYMEFLGNFIWRKYLDFAAVADIHSVKRQIDSRTDYSPNNLLGYNIKTGKGGIREIEFFAQTQQLVWGGREKNLRTNETCKALQELEKIDRLDQNSLNELTQYYEFYRDIEHRLQMVDDEPTHTLPKNKDDFEKFAIFMGFENGNELSEYLSPMLAKVQKYYAELFIDAPSLGSEGNLVFTGVVADPETLLTIAKLGFDEPEKIWEIIKGWHHGRRRATRFKRIREILTELTPHLLKSFASSSNPNIAFTKFDKFLGDLPSGVQLFTMFNEKPELIDLIAEIMGNSPWLAENLSRSPALVNRILSSNFNTKFSTLSELQEDLQNALKYGEEFDQKIKIIRRWKHDMEFQVGIRLLKNSILQGFAQTSLSNIAETVIKKTLELIRADITQKVDAQIAITAMGRLGTKELTFGSDLDLVFIYESDQDGAAKYAVKIAQKITNIFTRFSEDGILYNVDTRLRPQGNEGALATSFAAFKKYYAEAAWSWEFMALTKARVVAGDEELSEKLRDFTNQNIMKKRDKQKLAKDMADMRRKIAKSFEDSKPWDLKYSKGGIFEVEFIMQYIKLTESHKYPDLLKIDIKTFWNTVRKERLLPTKTANELESSYEFIRKIQSTIRLISQTGFEPKTASNNQKRLIVENVELEDFDKTEKKLLEAERIINKHYNEIFNTGDSHE